MDQQQVVAEQYYDETWSDPGYHWYMAQQKIKEAQEHIAIAEELENGHVREVEDAVPSQQDSLADRRTNQG